MTKWVKTFCFSHNLLYWVCFMSQSHVFFCIRTFHIFITNTIKVNAYKEATLNDELDEF